MIDNPEDRDMFWFSWQIHEISEKSIPADLWDCSADARRLFQHVDSREIDPIAIPSLTQPTPESGRVVIRGPLRGRGAVLNGRHEFAPKSSIRRIFQRLLAVISGKGRSGKAEWKRGQSGVEKAEWKREWKRGQAHIL
ncbi:MAG TPA: hypothetical protein VGP63_19615, partial [Planctomycetaceae bacterium]|nr:hypothetical protein [Planctomycetaceae bacterium]